MGKRLPLLLIAILVIALPCMGCTQEMGHIIRNDIILDDLGFAKKDGQPRPYITEEEVLDVMGLPFKYDFGHIYYLDDEKYGPGIITFTYAGDWVTGIDWKTKGEKPTLDDIAENPGNTDLRKSKLPIRHDIEESDLLFIDETVGVVEVQETLGAPHDFLQPGEVETLSLAYLYPLANDKEFRIAYEQFGVIVKAWVVDKTGEVQSVLIDRTDIYGTVDVE